VVSARLQCFGVAWVLSFVPCRRCYLGLVVYFLTIHPRSLAIACLLADLEDMFCFPGTSMLFSRTDVHHSTSL
jgi:hypothetical protein